MFPFLIRLHNLLILHNSAGANVPSVDANSASECTIVNSLRGIVINVSFMYSDVVRLRHLPKYDGCVFQRQAHRKEDSTSDEIRGSCPFRKKPFNFKYESVIYPHSRVAILADAFGKDRNKCFGKRKPEVRKVQALAINR